MTKRPFNPYKYSPMQRYDLRRILKGYETLEQIEKKEGCDIRTLRVGNKNCRALARRLEESWQGNPQLSPAKISDLSVYRNWLCGGVIRLFDQDGDGLCLHITPYGWQKPVGKLSQFQMRTKLKTEKRFLERNLSSKAALILGMDFSANTDSKRPGEVFWQPHMHGIIFRATRDDLKRLRARYRVAPSKSIAKPFCVTEVRDSVKQLTYILKINFRRWKPTYDRQYPREKMDRLRADERRELLLFLDQYHLTDLVLMHGVERSGSELKFTKRLSLRKRLDSSQKRQSKRPTTS